MKVTYNWLKDFVEIKISPPLLAEKLTMAGLEVVSLEKFDDDWVFEIEITTNRPDWLSVLGIAREISAITGKRFKYPRLKSTVSYQSVTALPLKIRIEDKKGCLRYIGRIIDNVEIKPSPSWLQKRLIAVGLRPINNVVDITNYYLIETGQPMHAFDYDKIEGKTIIVRRAKEGEEIVTIDGERRKLDSSILVIADEIKPIAIAGIMGGKDSEVSDSTKTILLESAYFEPITIRRASQKLGLVTESSYRFERKVDLGTVYQAPLFALELIRKFASSHKKRIISGKMIDLGLKEKEDKVICLNIRRVSDFLGKEITSEEIEDILEKLGFYVRKKKLFWEVQIPSFRRDIEIEEDLIEEIARIYGYDKFPLTLPRSEKIPQFVIDNSLQEMKKKIYETLLGMGFTEVITYSLVGKVLLGRTNLNYTEEWLRVSNYLSKEQEFLR
ncbi:MAG: phenylalanine--tRNA ligase subunit beta, partial [Candidatus Omnitrophota bacterium]